jgi:hypothetical protein
MPTSLPLSRLVFAKGLAHPLSEEIGHLVVRDGHLVRSSLFGGTDWAPVYPSPDAGYLTVRFVWLEPDGHSREQAATWSIQQEPVVAYSGVRVSFLNLVTSWRMVQWTDYLVLTLEYSASDMGWPTPPWTWFANFRRHYGAGEGKYGEYEWFTHPEWMSPYPIGYPADRSPSSPHPPGGWVPSHVAVNFLFGG